jgi:ABC-2 type transport system permease protein
MNTQTNVVTASVGAHVVEPHAISVAQRLYWSVRRELWENRSIYIAPLAVAVVFLLGFMVRTIHLPTKMQALALDPTQLHEFIEEPYTFGALLIMGSTLIVGIFYCLDALHGERRDRSILFWKSLPVSDFETVLSKASIPFLVLPLVTFAITVALQLSMLLLSTVVLLGSGQSAVLWRQVSLVQMAVMLLYHLLAIHSLWWAPFWGWLLLASAWARRAALLWAFLPLLAIGIIEKIAFNTSHFGAMLASRIGGDTAAGSSKAMSSSMASLTHLRPGQFLISPRLWIGFAITVALLAAAVRLRRNREPI